MVSLNTLTQQITWNHVAQQLQELFRAVSNKHKQLERVQIVLVSWCVVFVVHECMRVCFHFLSLSKAVV